MDFEKIKTDYEKRYGKECEKIFFVGMPLTFFGKDAKSISACLSVGEALAMSPRQDGRITIQTSGSDSYEAFNLSRPEKMSHNGIMKILEKAKKIGATTEGANLFIFRNSRLTDLREPLILGALSGFCKNVPPMEKLLPHFENFEQNAAALSGKRGSFTVSDGQRKYHLPFFDRKIKIVITVFDEGNPITKKSNSSICEDAVMAIKRGDSEKFGALLTKESMDVIRKNKAEKELGNFEFAKRTGDALGSGVIGCGKIFSLVQNEKVDTFIHNLSHEYRKFRGGSPEFYVTDFVDSGIFK